MSGAAFKGKPFAALVACNLFWGMSFPLMSIINQLMARHPVAVLRAPGIDAESMLAVCRASSFLSVRFLFALLFLALFLPKLVRETGFAEWLRGVFLGMLFGVGMLFQVLGLRDIPASRSAFLTSLTVVFTPVLMIVLERSLPRLMVVLGCVIACFGTAILTGVIDPLTLSLHDLDRLTLGDVLTTIGAVIFTLCIILIDMFSRRMPAGRITPGMFLGVVILTAPTFFFATEASTYAEMLKYWEFLYADRQFFVLTIFMGLGCTVLPFYWMNKYQPFFSPAHASLIYTLEPIFATLWAMVLPGLLSPYYGLLYPSEVATAALIFGGGAILLGNVVAIVRQ